MELFVWHMLYLVLCINHENFFLSFYDYLQFISNPDCKQHTLCMASFVHQVTVYNIELSMKNVL